MLSKPALTIGAGLSLVIEPLTIFFLVLLLLIEAPKMRVWILGQMRPPGRPRSPRCQPR